MAYLNGLRRNRSYSRRTATRVVMRRRAPLRSAIRMRRSAPRVTRRTRR